MFQIFFNTVSTISKRETQKYDFIYIGYSLVIKSGLLQSTFIGLWELLESSHWDALQYIKSLLECPMPAALNPESDMHVTEIQTRKTLKILTKLLDSLKG